MNEDQGCQWFAVLYNGVVIALPREWLCGLVLMPKMSKSRLARRVEVTQSAEPDCLPCGLESVVNGEGLPGLIFGGTLDGPLEGIVG